jgi:acyl-CoA synthetase (NDP forming)
VAETFQEFERLLEVAASLHGRPIAGRRIGAISNAGYEVVGMADALTGPHYQLDLPALSPGCAQQIEQVLAEHRLSELVNVKNPLDVTPMATDEIYEAFIRAMLEADNLDAVVAAFVPLSPAMMTTPREITRPQSLVHRLPELARSHARPFVVVIDSGPLYDPMAQAFREHGLAVFRCAAQAVRTLGRYMCHKLSWQKAACPAPAACPEPALT